MEKRLETIRLMQSYLSQKQARGSQVIKTNALEKAIYIMK